MAVGRARHRYRRLVPHSGGAVRHRRLQADGEADSDRRRAAAVVHARFGRPAGADRRLLRGARRHHGGRGARRDRRRSALRGLRLAAPQAVVLDDMDETVSRATRRRCRRSARRAPDHRHSAGRARGDRDAQCGAAALPPRRPMPGIAGSSRRRARSTIPACSMRIVRGRDIDAADYIDLVRGRADLIRRVAAPSRATYDALVMPTVPVVAPPLAELRSRGALPQGQSAGAAQSDRRQHARPLRHLDPVPSPRRGAGRADADRRAWRRPPPVRDRGRGRGRLVSPLVRRP